MVHRILVFKTNYSSVSDKKKFSYCDFIIVFAIFILGFTSITFLAFNFFKTAVTEEKLVENVHKVPFWIQWLRNYQINNSTTFESTLKSIDRNFVVCYYTKFQDVDYSAKLAPSNIDPYLCTHIIIGFVSILNNTIYLGNDLTIYKQVLELKKIVPNLKIMVSVGGAANDNGFAKMTMNDENRQKFVRSVLNTIEILNLDGIDLDWEFPSTSDEPGLQKIHFVQLIYELKKAFNQVNKKILLSAAVAAPKVIIDQSYDVPELARYLDFINLMSYDYHFYLWYYPVTDLNSPVYSSFVKSKYLASLNVNYSANYWVQKGMPKEKIIIGIPFYGHSYKLYNPSNHKLHAPSSGYGDTGEIGFVLYPEVCKFLRNGAIRVYVKDSHVPYAYKDTEWISYDDISSVTFKANWIKSNGFKGAMIYSLNSDDWNSTCSPNQKFPLSQIIKKILLSN